MSCILPTLRKYHNVKLYCISYQFRVDYFDGKKFHIACASQYCVGFHEKKNRLWMERGECGWKEANNYLEI